MGDAAKRPTYLTIEEFMEAYAGAKGRHELVDGVVRSMSPAAPIHSVIQSRLLVAISNHLQQTGRACEAVTEGVIKLHMGRRVNLRSPDIVVDCRSRGPFGKTFESPLVIIEVLSPSNESDTWETIRACATLPTLQEIVVVRTDEQLAQVFRRGENGRWIDDAETVSGSNNMRIACLDLTVDLASLYAGTTLE